MCYKNLGNICYVTFFGGAPVARKNKWGGPGQPPSLPMLMTTTVFTEIEMDFSAEIVNPNDFFAQKQVISKKKKKKKKVITDFSAEIENSHGSSGRITATTSQLRHPNSFGGRAIFIF